MGELSDDELRKTQLDDIVTLAEAAADVEKVRDLEQQVRSLQAQIRSLEKSRQKYYNAMNELLDDIAADDGFGTEQQWDPRGDGREGDVPEISSMADHRAVVEYIKNEPSTLEMFDSDVLAGIIADNTSNGQE